MLFTLKQPVAPEDPRLDTEGLGGTRPHLTRGGAHYGSLSVTFSSGNLSEMPSEISVTLTPAVFLQKLCRPACLSGPSPGPEACIRAHTADPAPGPERRGHLFRGQAGLCLHHLETSG